MSESMNAVIKRMMHWKQAPLDATVLAFNYLQKFYVYETMRGLSGVGNYRLKNMHLGAAVDKCDLAFPNDVCAPEKIVDLVKGKMVENEQDGEDKDHVEDLPINATVIEENEQQCTTANLTEFCISDDIKEQPIQYDIEKMRSHLIKCLEDKKFEKFPKKQKQKKRLSLTRKREFIQKINIDCAAGCSLPNVFDNMIACENPSCGQWYHLRCVGIQDPKESLVFMCPSCAD